MATSHNENESENSVSAAQKPAKVNTNGKLTSLIVSLSVIVLLIFLFFSVSQKGNLTEEPNIYLIISTLIGILIILIIWIPKWQIKNLNKISAEETKSKFDTEKERLKLEDDTRKTLAQIIGGAFLIVGVFVTYNTYRLGVNNYQLGLKQQEISSQKQDLDREQQELSREGQITDRFSKAIEHLGNSDISVRLGGLYALERVAKDSAKDHLTIIETISAFVRNKARSDEAKKYISPPRKPSEIPTDVQTAMTIIGNRTINDNHKEATLNLVNLNLSSIELPKANFQNAEMSETDFSFANLSKGNFTNATLDGANFINTNLGFYDYNPAHRFYEMKRGAEFMSGRQDSGVEDDARDKVPCEESKIENESGNFFAANLSTAVLDRAVLEGANLSKTNLEGTSLVDTRLYYANLCGAYLAKAKFIGADLVGANLREVAVSYTDFTNADLNFARISSESFKFNADLLKKARFDTIFIDGKEFNRENAFVHLGKALEKWQQQFK